MDDDGPEGAAGAAIPAPHLGAAQITALDLFLTGCALLRGGQYTDLAPRGIVRNPVDYRRFADDPLRWLRGAEEPPLVAFWLLVEEQHAARLAHFATP